MAAGFITYLSACSEDVRLNTVVNWWQQLEALELQMPVKSLRFDIKSLLVTEKEQLHWKSHGLPSDSLSIENAAVIRQVSRTDHNVDDAFHLSNITLFWRERCHAYFLTSAFMKLLVLCIFVKFHF